MINDPELGTISFKYNNRARRITIRIKNGELFVTLPFGATEQEGLHFINQVREKIKQKLLKQAPSKLLITETNPLQTLTFRVIVESSENEKLYSSLKSEVLTIEYPLKWKVTENITQEYFWNSINYFLKKEAKRVLPKQLEALAKKYSFRYSGVKIQPSKTRWGSCNSKKSINLSFYLLLLPQNLIDYVILHELCHTKVMNHSDKFWKLMDSVTDGKSKALRAEMRKYSMPK